MLDQGLEPENTLSKMGKAGSNEDHIPSLYFLSSISNVREKEDLTFNQVWSFVY